MMMMVGRTLGDEEKEEEEDNHKNDVKLMLRLVISYNEEYGD